jgi:CheY-like chemotaxis protein
MDRTPLSVLVVDDEALVRHTLEAQLKRHGCTVLQAGDGDAALRALEASSMDVVLIDLVMPGKEGIETIIEMRRRFPGVKIVALSGAFGGLFLQMARQLGADAVLEKPIRTDALRRTVRAVIDADADVSAPPPAGLTAAEASAATPD